VGWANASLRRVEQLPVISPQGGLGVVREDSLTAGMAPAVRRALHPVVLDSLRERTPSDVVAAGAGMPAASGAAAAVASAPSAAASAAAAAAAKAATGAPAIELQVSASGPIGGGGGAHGEVGVAVSSALAESASSVDSNGDASPRLLGRRRSGCFGGSSRALRRSGSNNGTQRPASTAASGAGGAGIESVELCPPVSAVF